MGSRFSSGRKVCEKTIYCDLTLRTDDKTLTTVLYRPIEHIKIFPTYLPITLVSINLYGNEIEEIPNLLELVNLQELYMAYNKIKIIPSALPPSLLVLDLDCNQIRELPETLQNLQHLTAFTYLNNPIEYISPNIREWLINRTVKTLNRHRYDQPILKGIIRKT